jgi:peptide/nickel transport system permease protein
MRRLLFMVPILILISIVIFFLVYMAPGGPMAVYATNPYVSAEELKRIGESLGLNRPLPIQYTKWFLSMVKGDWGYSYISGRRVTASIWERVPATLQLTGTAFFFTVIFGLPLGIIAALRRNTFVDYLLTSGAVVGQSIPVFWLAIMVILIFSVFLKWIPPGGISTTGMPTNILDRIHHLVAPSLVLSTVYIAIWSRYMRSSLLEVLRQDYVRAARAQGLSEFRVICQHALRNAILPIINLAGLHAPFFLAGALVTETVFSWPGIGRLFFDSLNNRDYPILLGILFIIAIIVLMGSLIADVLCAFADPRISYD